MICSQVSGSCIDTGVDKKNVWLSCEELFT
jgi:hypothetical protein